MRALPSLQLRRRGTYVARRASPWRRPLPDFLIIGTQKGGTTSLHEYLSDHPGVASPLVKEIQHLSHRAHRSAAAYRAYFPARGGSTTITGESTPYYLFHPLVPARARALVPDAKLIVLLRDPVDRAFSHHHHEVTLGHERLSFEEAIEREPARLAGEEERLAADPRYRSYAHQHHSYLARGRYADQLERWLAQFPREQVLVLPSEDLFADPAATLLEVERFLGLEPHVPDSLAPRNARSYAPLDPALRARLRDEFADDNARLEQLVGRSFPWG